MNTISTRDGLNIAYYVDDFTDPWTSPATIFLLHAAMGSALRWYSWVPVLARKYRVVRLDLRGHGNSDMPSPDSEFSLEQLVSDSLQVLDALKVDKAHIVGNSAGGYVSQKLAINHPDRVSSLALFGATPGLKHSQALTWLPKIEQLGLKNFLASTIQDRFDSSADPQLVQWFIEQTGSNDPVFIGRFIAHMCTHYFMDELAAIQTPTLIVAAGNELIGHGSAYEEMGRTIENCELKYIDTTGHAICDSHATQCTSMLLGFLDRLK